MTFQTLDEFKAVAEFFPRGKIIPQRIFKGPRKYKSRVTFGADAWALPTKTGYVVVADRQTQPMIELPISIIVEIGKARNAIFEGSPYTPGGYTTWIGNFGITESKQLDILNMHMSS